MHPSLPYFSVALLALLAAFAPGKTALADESAFCPPPEALLFTCETAKQKRITLCLGPKDVRYSYGPLSGPAEMNLAVPHARTTTWQWPGIGRTVSYAVNVPNGNVTYSIFSAFDRNEENGNTEGGVRVVIKGEDRAVVSCRPETIQDNLMDAAGLPPEE